MSLKNSNETIGNRTRDLPLTDMRHLKRTQGALMQKKGQTEIGTAKNALLTNIYMSRINN
jgi:hypothetical protein